MSANLARVTDIMSGDVLTLSPRLTLREASVILARNGLSGAPVVDVQRVVGVLSASDILDFIASSSAVRVPHVAAAASPRDGVPGAAKGSSLAAEAAEVPSVADYYRLSSREQNISSVAFTDLVQADVDLLERHTVDEIMTRNVISVPPSAGVHEAATYLFWAGIHRVLVMDGDSLLGVVSTMDIVEAVARGGLLST